MMKRMLVLALFASVTSVALSGCCACRGGTSSDPEPRKDPDPDDDTIGQVDQSFDELFGQLALRQGQTRATRDGEVLEIR